MSQQFPAANAVSINDLFKTLRWGAALAVVCALALWPAMASGGGVDVSVASVEVTQATQTATNSIALVSRRSTAVRATLDNPSGSAVGGITGVLRVFVNDIEVTPAAGVAAINQPFSAPVAPDRENENDTLNFELLAPTAITASSNVDFEVTITVPGDPDTDNNTGSADNLTAVNRSTPSLFFTRISFPPAGLGVPALVDVQPGVGDAFVQGIFPVDDSDPNLYVEGLFPTLTWNNDDGDGIVEQPNSEVSDLLAFLEACRQLIVDMGLGASDSTFLYGWFDENPISGNGWASTGGRVAFGNTQHSRHQRTYAHELTHNFGLGHNTRFLDEVGWDVDARLDGNPATNNTTGRVKDLTMRDIMVGGLLTDAAWVDTQTYDFLHSHGTLAPDEPDFSRRVLTIQGWFDPSGQEVARLNPMFRYPWLSEPTQRLDIRQPYQVRVTDVQGNITEVGFSAGIADDSGGEGEDATGFFSVMVPVDPSLEVERVQILNDQGQTIREVRRSQPPAIQIVSPSEGDTLTGPVEVQWQATDSDTPMDELMYQVAYSMDNGASWVPIAVNLPGTQTSATFGTQDVLEALANDGVLQVFVSDGLNTAADRVNTLTVIQPEPERLDHFKCYEARGEPRNMTVGLLDQFARARAIVREPVEFCNPVEKRRMSPAGGTVVTPITNEDNHLSFYRIETDEQTRIRQVAVRNQFGRQMLRTGAALYLAAPTQKLDPGDHGPPEGLDHFKCYRARGKQLDASVDLRDQFHVEEGVTVLNPVLFCNPVQKRHGDNLFEIQNEAAHQVCYRIETEPFDLDVRVRNQFGEETLEVRNPNLLCVPTRKINFTVEPLVFQFDYTHNVDINGESGVATATGTMDTSLGTITYDGFIDNYILGYRFWPVSWLTLVIASGGPVVALEEGGALNLLSLTDGELGHRVLVHTQDDFADIMTEIQVERDGDTIIATLNSVGEADYPDLVGMAGPVTLTQTPDPEGGFTETATKQLLTADGDIIESNLTAVYSGVDLPSPQVREVRLQVLDESEDRRNVRLLMETTVAPLTEGPTISGRVTLQFRTETTPWAGGIGFSAASVTIEGPVTETVPVDPDGSFESSGLPDGNYTLTASADGYLSAMTEEGAVVVSGQDVTVAPVRLLGGDVNTSGLVDINDVTAITASFLQGPPAIEDCMDAQGRIVDVNCSGLVDINDVTATVSNFLRASPQPWFLEAEPVAATLP